MVSDGSFLQRSVVNFISDSAAEHDEFGSHTRTAEAISAIVRSKRDLKVVGLLGPWGSGKSTVVKFAIDDLEAEEASERHLCFTYDAWLHQSDPPRRAFLEQLIRYLISKDLTTDDRWRLKLLELNRQVEDSDVQMTPALSEAGKWLLPLALLVPFGMQFLDHDWIEAAAKPTSSLLEHLAFSIGLFLTGLPIFAAAALWYWWRPERNIFSRRFFSRENRQRNRAPFEGESLLTIFTNKERVSQKSRTIRSPDPTTIEFQELFREILSEIKLDQNERPLRLILVIDNLDRLPEAQAIEMWATIRSFFLGAKVDVRMPVVILPIDERAVERMYSAHHPQDTAEALGKSFMDKTFDLAFYVNPPVLSNRHRYISAKLAYMFGGDVDESWAYFVGTFYDALCDQRQDRRPPTPRELNIILNQIGSFYLQWFSAGIHFASISYYSIFKKRIDDDIIGSVGEPIAGIEAFDPDWAVSIAAMHYGVPMEDAAQVLLSSRIDGCISKRDLASFAKISDIPGFFVVLRQMLDSDFAQYSGNKIRNAVEAISSIPMGGDFVSREIWRKLRGLYFGREPTSFNAADVAAWKVFQERFADDLPTLATDFANHLSRLPSTAYKTAATVDAVVDAAKIATRSCAVAEIEPPEITLRLETGPFVQALALFADRPSEGRNLRLEKGDAQISEFLVADLKQFSGSDAINKVISVLAARREGFEWKALYTAAIDQLSASYDRNLIKAASALISLRPLADDGGALVDKCVADGIILGRFNEAVSAGDDECAAHLAALILTSNKPAVLATPDGATWDAFLKARPAFGKALAKALQKSGSLTFAAFAQMAAKKAPLQALLRAVTSILYRSGDLSAPAPAEIANNYDAYYAVIDSSDDLPIVIQGAKSEEFWEVINGSSIEQSKIVLEILTGEESEYRARASKVALEKVNGLRKGAFSKAISEGGFPYDMICNARNSVPRNFVSGALAEELRSNLSYLKGADIDARNRWIALATHLSPSVRRTLLKTARDWLVLQPDISDPTGLLEAGGKFLLREGELSGQSEAFTRNIIIPIVEGGKIAWIVQNLDVLRPIIAGSGEDTAATLSEILKVSGEDGELSGDVKRLLAELDSLGLQSGSDAGGSDVEGSSEA